MKYFGLSNTGKVRGNNEDFFHVPKEEDEQKLFVVADGMGGVSAGEVASALAVADTVSFVNENYLRYDDEALLLRKAITKANRTVYDTSRSDSIYESMGTTLVAAIMKDDLVFVANVGDSRCYLVSNGNMEQVSIDHSFVQEMIDKGMLTKAEAKNHPDRNLITRAVGTEKFVTADVFCRKFEKDDRLLLATDGLTTMLDEETVLSIMKSSDEPETVARTLVEKALEAGGKDNVTVVVVINS